MIQKLRYKFALILMGVVTLILTAVFLALLLSTWDSVQRMSGAILTQALTMAPPRDDMAGAGGVMPPAIGPMPARNRLPILVADIGAAGETSILINHLHYMTQEDIAAIIAAVLSKPGRQGVLPEEGFRWIKSEDGARIALADASMEQDMLQKLILHSLATGGGALLLFLLISLLLSRWAVRPVALAWQRQQEFLADASHELKTPLTVILSNADMLRNDTAFTDSKKARRIEHIHAEALRMKKLLEDMLTLARSDSQAGEKCLAPVDLSFTVTSAVLTLEPLVFDEHKKLAWDVEEHLQVIGDAQRLRQLADILLDNARKNCPAGGQIHVHLGVTDKKNVLLTVFNEGPPIPQEELAQIFLRFYRVDKSRSSHDGFGLGLSIAQSIVKEHRGRIWAKSCGTGNSFFVSLPIAQ